MAKTEKAQKNTKTISGIVTSLSVGKNTIKVRVERTHKHPRYEKLMKKHTNFLVHATEKQIEEVELGERVTIQEIRPLSNKKTWKLVTK
jgi:ribosomal protein S17